jgi:metal-responsive CopG/Arc/MetJ family transcriptional regulator
MKKGISITVDCELLEEFDFMLTQRLINRSKMVDNLMQTELTKFNNR